MRAKNGGGCDGQGGQGLGESVRRLAAIAEALREGRNFPITRLTVIKALCREPHDSTQFVMHLELRPQEDLRFFVPDLNAEIEFHNGAKKGGVDRLVIEQEGVNVEAKRK